MFSLIDRIKATLVRLMPTKHIDTVKELLEPTESRTVWLSEPQKHTKIS